jgi:Holliday junction resolvase-like predicted endonuclease
VAWEAGVLVFVEVKTRLGGTSAPERAIDDEKMLALRRTARDYVRRACPGQTSLRFDVVTITGTRLEHMREAFPA